MADAENQDQVHKEGTEHIKDKVFGEGEGQGTATTSGETPKPIEAAKPPASNPGADDPSAQIPKDAGGVSSAAYVESPTPGNKEKRKSIVGQLKGLFLGGDKKEREASEAGTAKQGGTSTAAVAAGAAGTGVAAGQAVDLPDRTKENTASTSTTERIKNEGIVGDKEANTGTAAAPTSGSTENKQETSDAKMDEPKDEPKDTSGDASHKPPAPAGGKTPENREAIPTAGGERLGDKHWGESKIVPDNPAKQAQQESGTGVASAEGQPTEEVKDNTAKNTGGASGGPQSETPTSGGKKEKGKFMDKVKDKLPFGKKDKE